MDPLLAEQIAFYRAVAPEYFGHSLDEDGSELEAAIAATAPDGSEFDIVKVPHERAALQERLRALGWDIRVSTAGPFYWGEGSVSSQETHRDEADTASR